MEPEGSLPHSQEPANCPHSESPQYSPCRSSISNAVKNSKPELLPRQQLVLQTATRAATRWPLLSHVAEQKTVQYITCINIIIDYRHRRRCNKLKSKQGKANNNVKTLQPRKNKLATHANTIKTLTDEKNNHTEGSGLPRCDAASLDE